MNEDLVIALCDRVIELEARAAPQHTTLVELIYMALMVGMLFFISRSLEGICQSIESETGRRARKDLKP